MIKTIREKLQSGLLREILLETKWKVSKNAEAARTFLEFLTTDAADAVFEAVGFTPIA